MNNQNQQTTWDKSHHSIFENFALDLESFTDTGEYPAYGGQDLKYGLELQFERLKERNLKMKYDIVPRGTFADRGGPGRQWSDNRYISWMEYRTCRLSRTIYRDTKKVYEKNQNSIFYQIITNAKNPEAIAEELYSCPNCGALSQIAELQSGCPFCGTFFEMKELFPKVTNYFFIRDSGYTEKEIKRSIGKVMLPCIALCMIAFTIYYCFNLDSKDTYQILSSVIGGIIGGAAAGAIIGYFLWAILKLGSLFAEARKSIPVLVNSAGSNKRFVSFMRQYSSEFSYTGAVALKQFSVQGDYCYVAVDAYLENLYDDGSHIDAKKETIRVELRRNIRKPIDVNFSIERIQCKSCGASFNAAKIRNCPHCGTRYELEDDDWIVARIS